MPEFVHLHVHTEYSLLDGACRIEKLVEKVKSLGQEAVAITDHGVMYGVIDFYRAAKAQGIKPIIGCEVYVAPRTRFDKVYKLDTSPYHLVLLCKDNEGYQNLIAMVSKGFTEGFYNKPRVDKELLRAHGRGLIALSACLAGEIPRLLMNGDYSGAKKAALEYQEIFGKDNYYIEIQNHRIPEQEQILPQLIQLSRETGIGLVATNDAHYIDQEDHKMQNLLICIQTNRTVNDPSNLEFATQEFYIKSGEEMEALFGKTPDALSNTVEIARRCNVEFEFGQTKLPYFQAPDGKDNETYFKELCYAGLHRHYGENPPPEYVQRLEYELSIISQMGYVDYFLIVYDFIHFAKSQGIPVGPGRGSGAGSIAAYCVGITGIDPMKYQLLFERFLNPERISMPDFDIDFCFERRQEVIDYVVRKYGSDHVAQIITFGTMAARAAIRDVGRALGLGYQTVDTVAKLVPMELHMTIEKALKQSADLRRQYEANPQIQELIDMARKLEGMPRHASTHAAGVVITHDPVDTYVPVQKNEESIVTQFPMTTLEDLGLLKMDFLGLRNLTIIHRAEEIIHRKEPGFDVYQIPTDDRGVYEMLSAGQTNGVFQFESGGMRQVLMQLKPDSLEDLIAVISLYRPGPMESIPKYIQNRHNPQGITYRTPLLKPILDVTYGCIVYQEQVMQIFRELAGYSYGRADLVRKAMAKKKADVMEKERKNFIYGGVREDGSVECVGAVANGVSEQDAATLFEEMSSFASYAFNKSHAAAYAYISYQTAYLKKYYTKEYMAALLTSILDNTSKVTEYIGECMHLGIPVLPVDVNESEEGFTVTEEGIRFGLLAVKNIGRGFIRDLTALRRERPFSDFEDFCQRMYGKEINRRTAESLIKCGGFDQLNSNRKQLLQGYEEIMENIDQVRKKNLEGQMNFFQTEEQEYVGGGYQLPDVPNFSSQELLAMEKETTGIYITGHPALAYQPLAERLRVNSVGEFLGEDQENAADGKIVRLVGIITDKRTKVTKSGEQMAFVTFEDISGAMEMLVFPKVLSASPQLFQTGTGIVVRARLSVREEEEVKLICEAAAPADHYQEGTLEDPSRYQNSGEAAASDSSERKSSRPGLYLKVPHRQDPVLEKARRVLAVFDGPEPVYIYFDAEKKYVSAPRSLWVFVNDPMIGELKRILGEKNVVYRK